MVVGASWFVPADQKRRVPDVRSVRGLHRLVGVVDPGQERLAAQDRGASRGSVKAWEPFLPFPLPVLNSALGLMFFRASCLCPENSVAQYCPCRDCVAGGVRPPMCSR